MLLASLLLATVFSTVHAARESLTEVDGFPLAGDFTLPDMDGKTHKLSDLRGKTVIINFWATWCPPCRAELPSMNRAWAKLKYDDIIMIAINVGENEDTIFSFMGDYPIDFLLLMDQNSQLTESWPVKGLPTTYIIDPLGRLHYRAIGSRDWDAENLLNKLRALQ